MNPNGKRAGLLGGRLQLPAFVQARVDELESVLVRGLKMRLDHLQQESATTVAATPPARARRQPARLLRELLDRSLEQTADSARLDWYLRVLRELVPDEARILAALSDGSAYALLHVTSGPRVGAGTRRHIENVSNVGRAAGVQWLEMTPAYVSHLRDLGLADTGPEDAALEIKYQLLETDDVVRSALGRVKQARQKETIVRRTLRITDLGRALWAACQPDDDQEGR